MNTDLIFGLHSIAEAINNSKRGQWSLIGTDEAIRELRKLHFDNKKLPETVEVTTLSTHKLQEKGKFELKERGYREQRVPSNIMLVTGALEEESIASVYDFIEKNDTLRMMALDQVTDIHNLAAIMRTAAFYNLDFLLISKKGKLSFPPSYYRIASGAAEHVKLINCSGLPRAISKMMEKKVECIGLAEEATTTEQEVSELKKACLVMGAEDTGLSNATRRVLEKFVSLTPQGQIKSLNVSVAAALSMEKFL